MKTTMTVGAILAALVATPLVARGQTLTAVVNRTNVHDSASFDIGDDLTEVFLGALLRTRAFNVVDGRVGREVDADFYLNTVLIYGVTLIGPDDDPLRRIWADADLTAVDGEGNVFHADSLRRSKLADPSLLDVLLASPEGTLDISDIIDDARSMLEELAGRVATYFSIMGERSMPVESVEGRVVSIVDATTAIIDIGSGDGLRLGDALEVQRSQTVTNANGDVIFSRSENIGTAEVGEIQAQGALITVSVGVEEGDTVVRTVPLPATDDYVDSGDSLMEAALYVPAVREYLAALRSDPDQSGVLFNLGLAQIISGDSDAGYESAAAFFDAGFALEVAATHHHGFSGPCRGTFVLTRDSASYRSPQEDDPDHWFDVPLDAVVEAGVRLMNDEFVLRAPSTEQVEKNEGDSKNWTLVLDHPEALEVARILARYISGS